MGGFFMGTELNQALVQQALSFAPEITEERQAVKVWEDGTVEFYLYAPTAETVEVAGVLMRRRLHSCRMETEGFTGR
jgi:hypothetical protein